jgi:hypothetical protein
MNGPAAMLKSGSLHDPTWSPTPQAIAQHGADFMGGSYDASGKWVPNPSPGTMTSGFPNYTGNVEAILKETYIRAMEVSLGLEHAETLAQQPPERARFWPIEVLWKCPTAWVEGWVTWQRAPDGSGHVTLHLLTPSHNHYVLTSPGDGRDAEVNPTSSACANGMWVITHQKNKMSMTYRIDYSEFGNWTTPTYGPVYQGTGPIVVVSPSEKDGGVSCWGRPYTAPGTTSTTTAAKKATKKKKAAAKKTVPRKQAATKKTTRARKR